MARKPTRPSKTDARGGEIRIKENAERDEFFHRHDDPYVLPPELNMTIKDGFRFGLGFVLALLVFYLIALVGVVVLIRFGSVIGLG